MLRDLTLFGERDKVQIAIKRLREFEPEDGYYLAFSGGKDSVVIKALADMAGVRYDAHYSLTTVDPPELVQFIRQEHKDVAIERPKLSMWQIIVRHGIPPSRMIRYCCRELKEDKGGGRTVMLGVRWAESHRRSGRKLVEACNRVRKWYVNPIIDWEDADVWQFIREQELPYCCLYDEGYKRLGCILCPMQGTKGMLRDAERWPKYKAAYIRAFDRMLAARKRPISEGLNWTDGEAVYHWWVYNPPSVDKAQIMMWG